MQSFTGSQCSFFFKVRLIFIAKSITEVISGRNTIISNQKCDSEFKSHFVSEEDWERKKRFCINQAGKNYRIRILGSRRSMSSYILTNARINTGNFNNSGFSALGTNFFLSLVPNDRVLQRCQTCTAANLWQGKNQQKPGWVEVEWGGSSLLKLKHTKLYPILSLKIWNVDVASADFTESIIVSELARTKKTIKEFSFCWLTFLPSAKQHSMHAQRK